MTVARYGVASLFVVAAVALWCGVFVGVVQQAFGASPIDACPQLPPHTPTSIHDLHPNNINVVMALGDSITAGFGLGGREGLFEEFRGQSWSIGGDPGAITLFNFFKHFNPNVVGASLGTHFAELPYTDYWPNDHLNAAQSNAGVDNLLYQIDYLHQQLSSNPKVDMKNDWKILTLLIGANDACPLCWEPFPPTVQQAADSYEMYLSAAIKEVYKKIPRVFFNILPMFNVSQVYNITLNTTYCRDLHDLLPFECTCAFDTTDANRIYLDSILQAYDARIYKLVAEWKARNLTDFAVQVQPWSQYLVIPNLSYLSTLDCFHPSLLAEQRMSIATWNSLIIPDNKKPRHFKPNDPLICPTKDSLLYT
jgi:phospholipase B1